jgi:probable HAF family extracellular repeat protein
MKKIIVLLALVASSPTLMAQTKYVVVDLGSAGGTSVSTTATNINNAGQVAGSSINSDYSSYRAYRTAPNKPINPATDLIPLPTGATYNYVNTSSLNNLGQVAFDAGLSNGYRLDADGTTHDLGNLGGLGRSNAWGINDYGQVTGQSDIDFFDAFCSPVGTQPAFRTEPNSAMVYPGDDLGTLFSGCRYSIGTAINSLGQVVGYSAASSLYNPEQHAMLASPGSAMKDLGVLGGTAPPPGFGASAGYNAIANAINTAGQIVGYSTYNGAPYYYAEHAFLTSAAGPMQDLGTLGGNFSYAFGINNSGEIVGQATTAGDAANDGFLYTGGTMVDLNTLIGSGSGWSVSTAWAINDNGQIAATVKSSSDGTYHPARLDPSNVAVTILTHLLSDPSLALASGQIASLTDKLNNALASIQAGLHKQAINQLMAFISAIQMQQKTGKMTLQTATTLTNAANAIITSLS